MNSSNVAYTTKANQTNVGRGTRPAPIHSAHGSAVPAVRRDEQLCELPATAFFLAKAVKTTHSVEHPGE